MDAPSNEMYTGKAIRFLARLAGGTRPLVDIMNVPDNIVSYQAVQRASLTARGFIKEKQWQRLFDELHSPSSERAKELVEDIRSFVLVIRDLVDAGILKIASEMAALDALCETQEEAQEETQEETQEEAQGEVQVQSEEDDDDDLFKFISVPEIRTIHATQQHEENVAEQMQQQSESKPEEKKLEKKSFLETFINGGEEKKESEIQHDKSITDPFESDLDRFPDVFDSGEHKF